jgi:hypothetical protein
VTNQPAAQFPSAPAPVPSQQFAPPPPPVPVPQLPGLMLGHGLIRVNIQGSMLTSSMIVPSLMIDGRLLTSQYGVNAFQVPAGRHRVELYAQWMRRYGQATLDVEVGEGGVAELFYAAPLHQFTTGSIGLTKQHRKGWLFMGVFLGLFFAMIFAGVYFAYTLG